MYGFFDEFYSLIAQFKKGLSNPDYKSYNEKNAVFTKVSQYFGHLENIYFNILIASGCKRK